MFITNDLREIRPKINGLKKCFVLTQNPPRATSCRFNSDLRHHKIKGLQVSEGACCPYFFVIVIKL